MLLSHGVSLCFVKYQFQEQSVELLPSSKKVDPNINWLFFRTRGRYGWPDAASHISSGEVIGTEDVNLLDGLSNR
jgi:hypothetical protein